MKKITISLLVIIALTLGNVDVFAVVTQFKDVKSTAWYYTYVERLVNLNITSGYSDGTFKPDNSVTRAEFVTFLCKANGLEQTEGYTFTDTQKHWASKWITTAVTENIIDKGTSFNPNTEITRQEAVEMLCRSLKLEPDAELLTPYSDVKTNSGYSSRAYEEYLMMGTLTSGKRYFYPENSLKRSEVSAVIVNLVDYKADTQTYKTVKRAELDTQKTETSVYDTWKASVKNISPILLNNANGLVKSSVFESYKYLRNEESDYLKNWGAKYNMTPTEFENEMVRVGTKFMETWYNANYTKIDKLETDLRSILEFNIINNDLQRNLDYVKNNKFVSEGKFTTSTGMLVFTDWGNPVLRGTIKYRYLSPTSTNVLKSELIGSTNKNIQLGVWYEQDYEVDFYPEKDGLKAQTMSHISDIRLAK